MVQHFKFFMRIKFLWLNKMYQVRAVILFDDVTGEVKWKGGSIESFNKTGRCFSF